MTTTQATPRITPAMLRFFPTEQRKLFESEWPKGMDVTLENVLRADEIGIALFLYGRMLLSQSALRTFVQQEAVFLQEYDRKRAALWAKCRQKTAPLWYEAYMASVGAK